MQIPTPKTLDFKMKKQYEITHGRTSYQLEKSKNELSDVEQILYSQDRFIREQLQKEIDERIKK